jgi:hypothetical protein
MMPEFCILRRINLGYADPAIRPAEGGVNGTYDDDFIHFSKMLTSGSFRKRVNFTSLGSHWSKLPRALRNQKTIVRLKGAGQGIQVPRPVPRLMVFATYAISSL